MAVAYALPLTRATDTPPDKIPSNKYSGSSANQHGAAQIPVMIENKGKTYNISILSFCHISQWTGKGRLSHDVGQHLRGGIA